MSGSAVPEGFTLPWNTTRTMADVWSKAIDGNARRKSELAGIRAAAAKADELERQRRFVSDYQNLPKITPRGKIAYAGAGK